MSQYNISDVHNLIWWQNLYKEYDSYKSFPNCMYTRVYTNSIIFQKAPKTFWQREFQPSLYLYPFVSPTFSSLPPYLPPSLPSSLPVLPLPSLTSFSHDIVNSSCWRCVQMWTVPMNMATLPCTMPPSGISLEYVRYGLICDLNIQYKCMWIPLCSMCGHTSIVVLHSWKLYAKVLVGPLCGDL